MVLNKNAELKKLHTFSDKLADFVTSVAGSMTFLLLNVAWFGTWILMNEGVFGNSLIVDKYPFSFLTTAVSLEAIILSSFVLMSQKRQSKLSELRTELDYRTDLQAEADIKAIVKMLERLAKKQGVEVSDLVSDMKTGDRRIVAQHPANISKD